MSYWTHIVGVMHIDTYEEVDDIKAYVEEKLKDAPKITGSESDAAVFVNPEPDHNIFISMDCNRCEYNDTIQVLDDGFCCGSPNGYICPSGRYQSRAIITVCGDLRDRMRAQTKREWNAFHRYVAKQLDFGIRIATCKIDGW